MAKSFTHVETHKGRNVLALLEGSDANLKSQAVLLTAHHDHMGEIDGHIYNGADDNASGVAALLEIARAITADHVRPKRSILFVSYDGEERIFLGSYYYVTHPVVPLRDTITNINMDMIGRDENDANWPIPADGNINMVNVLGTRYNPDVRKAIDEAEYKKNVRRMAGATIDMGGFGEVLARYENEVSIDPNVKDAWGIPVLRFNYKFGENERKMCEDMARTGREMFEAAKFEILSSSSNMLTEGWSIHELGTARMGNDPKTSVVNQHQQFHEVKNLFVVDGSTHVNASCQNPTWTIMALCWRTCDYLADQMKKGEV